MTYYNYFGSEKAADFILYVDILYNEAYYITINNYDEDRIRKNQKKREKRKATLSRLVAQSGHR